MSGDEIVTDEVTGEKYLVQDQAATEAWVRADMAANLAAHEAMVAERLAAARNKAESTAAKGVPPEKSPL